MVSKRTAKSGIEHNKLGREGGINGRWMKYECGVQIRGTTEALAIAVASKQCVWVCRSK